jgi:hypothetical protein
MHKELKMKMKLKETKTTQLHQIAKNKNQSPIKKAKNLCQQLKLKNKV